VGVLLGLTTIVVSIVDGVLGLLGWSAEMMLLIACVVAPPLVAGLALPGCGDWASVEELDRTVRVLLGPMIIVVSVVDGVLDLLG